MSNKKQIAEELLGKIIALSKYVSENKESVGIINQHWPSEEIKIQCVIKEVEIPNAVDLDITTSLKIRFDIQNIMSELDTVLSVSLFCGEKPKIVIVGCLKDEMLRINIHQTLQKE